MAYIDSQLEFSDAQAVTTTAISTNVYDLLSMGVGGGSTDVSPNTLMDIGLGEDVWLVVSVPTTATAAGAATITVSLESDSTANLATSPTVHYTSAAIPVASAAAGATIVRVKLPSGSYERYLGVRYTIGTGPLTAGAFDAYLTYEAVDANRPYKSGFTVA